MIQAPGQARAQTGDPAAPIRLGAHGIGMFSRIDPAIGGRAKAETYLTQAMVQGHASFWTGRLTVAGTLNLEGLTMPDGELAPGNAGEGFVDRRHPHTYLHELVATFDPDLAGLALTLSAGRGFAPFGTDDPMVRPFVRYPANHHWAQILERWTVSAAARRGPVTIEAGLFNGSEPTGPESVGGFDRFGDSWALRGTLRPSPWLELQGSFAFVESPEFEAGLGLDQKKWSTSARLERSVSPGSSLYLFLETAQTDEYADGRKAFIFTSVLAETAWRPDPWTAALRFERTSRPEEERLRDPYRSPQPHAEQNIIGATRWTTVTAHAARSFSSGGLDLGPFVEVSRSSVQEIAGAVFDPVALFGSDRVWSVSLGLRVRTGMQHTRMGRYGAARPPGSSHADHDMRTTNRE